MTTTKRGHCCSRSAFGKVRFSGHKSKLNKKGLTQVKLIGRLKRINKKQQQPNVGITDHIQLLGKLDF